MPCFHTHWLVALQAIQSAPKYIGQGKQEYVKASLAYRLALIDAIDARASDSKQSRSGLRKVLEDAAKGWKDDIQTSEKYDAITCFSAYMLGACGPDFWTVPSHSSWDQIPDTASEHFDLGHYNRTHSQFELSVAHVGGPKRTDLDALAQRAYFLGMATHIAADLVVHQLVNFSAGAYNLLEHWNYILPDKAWQNEDWTFSSKGKNLWNTHNKIEHYWDSYVRYRYLGDQAPFWPEEYKDQENWFPQLGFPTCDSLLDYAKKNHAGRAGVLKDCEHVLKESSIKYLIERPLMFPWVFCDRVFPGESDIAPFIYRLVVDETSGAYPSDVAPKKVVEEKKSYQMEDEDAEGGHSERKKLHFFSSAENEKDDPTSFNFLTFHVCPNVERTKLFGFNIFYHLPALRPFLQAAVAAAGKFLGALSHAYQSGKPADIGPLGYFWNLDTGLGLRITPRHSDTDRECITELNFVHIFDRHGGTNLSIAPPVYLREQPYARNRPEKKFGTPAGPPVYPTYLPEKPFDSLLSVQEADDKKYLEEIKVSKAVIPSGAPSVVQTCSLKSVNVREATRIAQRLNLRCRIAIGDFGAIGTDTPAEKLAMFFMGDKKGPPGKGVGEETHKWLGDESKVLDYTDKASFTKRGLQHFVTHILVNTERSKDAVRKIAACEWNNVIPYKKTTATHGRNFAISTGRQFVLKARDGGAFKPLTDFECCTDISPTEHIFFTIHALAFQDGAYYDLLSKETVDAGKIPDLKRIDETGVVKILLIYKFAVDGHLVLAESYVDGLPAKP
jgi:hypothetical protein